MRNFLEIALHGTTIKLEDNKYVVGDKVRLLHTDYNEVPFTIGNIYEVKYVGDTWVGLYDDNGEGDGNEEGEDTWAFYIDEVEPA